jgi:hypothetical protein
MKAQVQRLSWERLSRSRKIRLINTLDFIRCLVLTVDKGESCTINRNTDYFEWEEERRSKWYLQIIFVNRSRFQSISSTSSFLRRFLLSLVPIHANHLYIYEFFPLEAHWYVSHDMEILCTYLLTSTEVKWKMQ